MKLISIVTTACLLLAMAVTTPIVVNAQTCYDKCDKAIFTCCSGSYYGRDYGKCDEDQNLDDKCNTANRNCERMCGADAKASTKVTTDFDIDIEGAFVEEA